MKATISSFKKRKLTASSSEPSTGVSYQQQETTRRNVKSSLLCQAEELRSRLEAKYPSFAKSMLRSHVASCFWMGLPLPFCKMYMPQNDTYFTLEDEKGSRYRVKYLAKKTALSGGWRGFSIAEKLSEGDVLVFHLVKPTKFKVYIFRKNIKKDTDVSHVIIHPPTEAVRSDLKVGNLGHTIEAHRPSSLLVVAHDKEQEILSKDDSHILQQAEYSEKAVEDIMSLGNSKNDLYAAAVGNGIGSFEEFLTVIDELLKKEYDLPHNIKSSYYKLCCSQGEYLHIHSLKGVNQNPLLIAGCIIEIVNVAVAMKRCELNNFNDEFAIWDEKLKSLKIFGMKVEFLFSHLDQLQKIACDPEAANNKQQYMELCSEHDVSECKIKELEAKLNEAISMFNKRSDEIKELQSEIENHKSSFLKLKQVSALY